MFRAHMLIIRRSKLHYTASGIITPIGGRLVHETATYRCDDTRDCVMQFWPHDDEHMCSKHVEAWNKLIVKQKFCASSWLIAEINDNSVHLLILFTYPFLILSDPSQSQFTVCNHQPTDQCLRGLGGGKPVQITEARQCGRGAEDRLMFLSLSVVT